MNVENVGEMLFRNRSVDDQSYSTVYMLIVKVGSAFTVETSAATI